MLKLEINIKVNPRYTLRIIKTKLTHSYKIISSKLIYTEYARIRMLIRYLLLNLQILLIAHRLL